MRLGDVLRKERQRRGLSTGDCAEALRISSAQYQALERGETEIERWVPVLTAIAVELAVPTSRLLAESGSAEDARTTEAGELIRKRRQERQRSTDDLARAVGLSSAELERIEAGESPIEEHGAVLLAFAELIDQPVFNLVYPCGLPFQELDDYP